MRILVPIFFFFLTLGCASLPSATLSKRAPEALKPVSFKSRTEAVRWMASVDAANLRAPNEIRLFEAKDIRDEKTGRRPVGLLRVRASEDGTRQIFERCEIAAADFSRDRERAGVTECQTMGNQKGYDPALVSNFVTQSAGQALGPDWQAVRTSLASMGIAASGAIAFFILDPTKLLASASAGIAVLSGANVIVEARRQNVLDPQTSTLLSWNAASPELSIVSVNGALYDNERVLRIALRRIDDGLGPLKFDASSPNAAKSKSEAFDLIPLIP